MQLTVIARSLTTGTEATNEVQNSSFLVTGARLAETNDGLPYLRIEPRVEKGLTITEDQAAGEANTTSKIGIKLQPVPATSFFYGLEYVQDATAGKTHEWFVRPKLGTGLQFNVTTGAIEATGGGTGSTAPATAATLGTVIVGSGLSVITTPGATQGTISVNTGTGLQITSSQVTLKVAAAGEIGGVRINGNGLSIAGDGTLSVTNGVSGGTADYVPLWSSATALTSSVIYQTSSNIGIGTTAPGGKLTVAGGSLVSSSSQYALHTSAGLSAGRLTSGATSKLAAIHTWHDDSIVELSAGSSANFVTGILLGARNYTSAANVGDRITFWTRSTKQVEIDSSGNVGIGQAPGSFKLDVAGTARLAGNLTWATDSSFDVGASGQNRPRDLYLSRTARLGTSLVIGTDPNPASGGGFNAPLRVAGVTNASTGYNEAAYFTGTVFASDFVLIDGTGAVSSASPPIVVVDEAAPLNTTVTPLSQLTFTGAGVTASLTAAGQVTVNIPGGGGGISMQSGSSTANALPKFFNAATTPTLANSRLSDDGTTITLGGTTTVSGLLTLVTGTATVAPLRFGAGTSLTTPVAGSMEWNGTNLFVTQTTGPTRKTLAFTDSNITGTAANVTGTVAVANGGTGLTATPTNGQLLIGNGTGYTLASLTAGTNVTITPGVGTITIAASGGGGSATIADDTTTNAARYVLFEDVTSGSMSTVNVASTKLTFNPSTGVLTASGGFSGNATTATTLQTARNINGVSFNGSADITVAAAAGTLTGTTLASGVTASSLTSVGTLGSLTVTNTITAAQLSGATTLTLTATGANNLTLSTNGSTRMVVGGSGNITMQTPLLFSADNTHDIGAVSSTRPKTIYAATSMVAPTFTGALSGNATTASTLQTARNINGVSFNGSADITVAAAAGTLTGSTLASGVTASSLTSVGTLTSVTVSGTATFNGTVGVTNITTNSATWKVGGVQYATIGTALPATAPDGAIMVLY